MVTQKAKELQSTTQSSKSDQATRPTLWVTRLEELIAPEEVIRYFRTIHIASSPSEIARPGEQHIIINEDESVTCAIGMKLQDLGCQVDVFTPDTTLSAFAFGIGMDAPIILLNTAKPFESWQRELTAPINLEEAMKVAKVWLASGRGNVERNIALENLRKRTGVSAFDWNRYIKHLEEEIHAAVEAKTSKPLSPIEEKRLELKIIAQERDSFKATDKIVNFCRTYGWSKRDVEQHIRLLKNSTTTPKAKRLKGKDFLALETESISWVFPGTIPGRGVVVVGGDAGVGKTTFAYDAAGSLLRGEEFLGEKPVKTGKVLVVSGDELPCFTQDKLIERGVPEEDWEILLNWDISQWDVLEEAIADLKPALVIIDSFSSIHRDPNFDENSSQAKSTIYDLEALTNTYDCGCLLIHHLSKSKDSKGVGRLRGSSAISAAASVVCLMEAMGDGGRKVSFPKIRGAQTQPFIIDLDGETGRYKVLGGGDDISTKSLGERILTFLQKSPDKRYEQSEISDALSIPPSHKDSVYQALGRLFNRGLITKRPSKYGGRRKVYGVANPLQLSHTEGLRNVTDTVEDTPPPIPTKCVSSNL